MNWASFTTIFLCTIVAYSSTASDVRSNLPGDDLQTLIEKLMAKVKQVLTGNDPYKHEKALIDFNSYGILMVGSATDSVLTGLSTFNLTYLSVTQKEKNINLEVDMNFENLQITGNYDFKFNMLTLLRLFGNGQFGAKVNSTNLNITAEVNQGIFANDALQFKTLDIHFKPSNIKVDVKNLLKRPALSEYISNLTNDLLPAALEDGESAMKVLSQRIKSYLNKYIMKHGITLAFVIDVIQKFIQ